MTSQDVTAAAMNWTEGPLLSSLDIPHYLLLSDDDDVCADVDNTTEGRVCNGPHSLDDHWHTVLVYGYVTPVLVLVTFFTNLLVCIVLMRSTRSPTNTLLVAMAVSDTLTGVWTVPCYLHFYTGGKLQVAIVSDTYFFYQLYSYCTAN